MKLYELADEFKELFEKYDDLFEENSDPDLQKAWFDTLEGIEAGFKLKAENLAVYIKNIAAEAEALEMEEKRLKERKNQKKIKLENMKNYLKAVMDTMNLKKIETSKATISIRSNAESLEIDDESAFIHWAEQNNDYLLKYSMPEIRKTEVKKLIQSGKNIPNVHLERGFSLIVK